MFSTTSIMFLLTGIGFCIGITIYSIYIKYREDIYWSAKFALLPFMILTGGALLFVCLYFDGFYDFIANTNTKYFIYTILGTLLIYASTYVQILQRYNFLIILTVALVITHLQPQDIIIYDSKLPIWCNPIITAVIWTVFAYIWKYLNGVDGIALEVAAIFCIGTMFMLWFGGIPTLLGYQAATILGLLSALFLYNKYPSTIKISSTDCTSIGFLLGSILITSIPEKSWPCITIFALITIGEFVYALSEMLLKWKVSDITSQTAYYQANISGLSPYMIYRHLLRIGTILIIFGCLELYAPNNYSCPTFAGILTLWYLFKLKNWTSSEKSIKEINQDVLQEIKQGLQKIKDSGNKD